MRACAGHSHAGTNDPSYLSRCEQNVSKDHKSIKQNRHACDLLKLRISSHANMLRLITIELKGMVGTNLGRHDG